MGARARDRLEAPPNQEHHGPTDTSTVLLVLTNALPGREEELDTRYTDVHMGEVVAEPGVVSARRFQLGGTGAIDPRILTASFTAITDTLHDRDVAEAGSAT